MQQTDVVFAENWYSREVLVIIVGRQSVCRLALAAELIRRPFTVLVGDTGGPCSQVGHHQVELIT